MLVENTEPKARSIGTIILIPGWNQIEDAIWKRHIEDPKWKKPIKGLVQSGVLKLKDPKEKLTIATVEKTYDMGLLEDWYSNPDFKGPLRGALKKQIELMKVEVKDTL